MSSGPTAKVLFRVPDGEGGAMVETLWATPLGDDLYELDNQPFYAYDVAWQDVVLAPFDADEGIATFQRVVEHRGHRAVRLKFSEPMEAGNAAGDLIQSLVAMGCSYEGANRSYIAVGIPPEVDAHTVHELLNRQAIAQWEHASPSYDTLYPEG